ncbi:hypothetical protein WJX73_007074 [Symbiochloris irregularis]|uniref:F-box domain-containing protein n=1 Tax=Symbiochloris irregularis TaxID=706552 RepID=A0AAW1NVW3_9CHLO
MASAGLQPEQVILTSPGIRDALICEVLPRLPAPALAALSCTCKALREVAIQQDCLWRSAATQHLPPQHPSLSGMDRSAVQSILQRRYQARCNILEGKLPGQAGQHSWDKDAPEKIPSEVLLGVVKMIPLRTLPGWI